MFENIIKKLLISLFKLKTEIQLKRKIKLIYGNLKKNSSLVSLDDSLITKHKNLFIRYFNKKVNIKWLKSYITVSNINDYRYIPENIYYNYIEPKLNNYHLSKAYADKNFYELFFPELKNIFVKTYLRKINNCFYDTNFNLISNTQNIEKLIDKTQKYIIKPSIDSGGGINVFEITGNDIFNFINKDYDFIVQEKIIQHSFFSQFNESSVNTIRLFSYKSVINNQIYILQGVFRIGKPGSIVDNQAAGGLACAIDLETSKLNNFVSDKYGNKYYQFNNINFSNDYYIPHLQEMKELAIYIASRLFYFRLLSFDFCVDNMNNIKLIEINNKNHEINFYQFNNGPLFNSFTEEILSYCKDKPVNFLIDFKI